MALSLALPKSDYPSHARIVAIPATNGAVDHYLHPVHRSSFRALGRVDGLGWLQAATWPFKTGQGAATHYHLTIFGYAINVFRESWQAQHALADLKIKTRRCHLSHLPARSFHVATVRSSLTFTFFAWKTVEVEAYYEYTGVAPASIQDELRRFYGRQSSQLVRLARRLVHARGEKIPSATPTVTALPTPSPTAVDTSTSLPTTMPTATATAVLTPTATPSPTATSTPSGLLLEASPSQPSFKPGDEAPIDATVTFDGRPVAGAAIEVTAFFPGRLETCTATTDTNGMGSCWVAVPPGSSGSQVQVQVEAGTQDGRTALITTSFTVE